MSQRCPDNHACVPLPGLTEAKAFAEFVQSVKEKKSGFVSRQHEGAIPDFAKKDKVDFVNFLHRCRDHELGFQKVRKLLDHRRGSGQIP